MCSMHRRLQPLDKASPIPLYYQLFLRLQAAITAGLLRPGDLLGTEKEIQERYGVSRSTVRKALDELARGGRLVRITGRGTFIAEPASPLHVPHLLSFTEEMRQRGRVPGARVLVFERTPCPAAAADALHCRAGERVLHIRRLRTGDGQPVLLVDHLLAPSIRIEQEDLEQSLYATLERKLGIRLEEAYHTVGAARCTADEAALLGGVGGDPVLRFARTTLAADGRPVVYEYGTARADRYEYSVHLYRREGAGGLPAAEPLEGEG
jgi:GntR family transcriptional regulator